MSSRPKFLSKLPNCGEIPPENVDGIINSTDPDQAGSPSLRYTLFALFKNLLNVTPIWLK